MARGLLTEAVLSSWHQEINDLCFDGVLPMPSFYIGLIRGADAPAFEYEACYYADSIGRGTVFINPDFLANAKASLAHEMIHQWQDLCGLRLDHRAVFKAWAEHITQLTGLVA